MLCVSLVRTFNFYLNPAHHTVRRRVRKLVEFSKSNVLLLQQVKVPMWAVEKQYYEMPELVGFQTMVILDPNGMTFDAVSVFGLDF